MNGIHQARTFALNRILAPYLIGILLASTSTELAASPPAPVQTDIAVSELASATVDVSGVVVSLEDAKLASELDGRLTWVAEVGDRVLAGEPVAMLDDHLRVLDLRDAEADIARLQANLGWLERQAGRLEKLAATNNTAQAELDEVRSRHAMLEQELATARVALERSDYQLRRARVLAPFDGVVAERNMSAGEYAERGQVLLRLVNTGAAEVSVTAPLRLARYVEPGALVSVFNGDRRSLSTVRSLVPVGDSRSHMMEVRVALAAADWLIGEPVMVALPESEPIQAVTVPRDALVLRDRHTYLFTVDGEATARLVEVTVGRGRGERIAVEGLVLPGDQVVTRGGESLRDGQSVTVLQQGISSRN
jgi:RND family efflux transporter MFP subunit